MISPEMNSIAISKDQITRAEIMTAARNLFQRFGLFRTTMEDIARAAGKGKSSLYYYYTSKDDIFNMMVQEDMDDVFAQVSFGVAQAATAEEKLKAFSNTKIKALHQKVSLYGIVFGEISENPQLVKRLKKDYEAKELELLKSILRFGIEHNEFKKVSNEDLDHLCFIMLSSIRGIEIGVLEECPMKKISDRLDFVRNLLCHGIKM